MDAQQERATLELKEKNITPTTDAVESWRIGYEARRKDESEELAERFDGVSICPQKQTRSM